MRVFLGCFVLGVAAIAAIGSLAASLTAGIAGDARELLGGDVEARLAYRPADAAEHAFLARSGTLSEVATLRAMARKPDGSRHSLIELKAVDAAYPLYGRVVLAPAQALGAALGSRDGVFGAVVDPALLDRLGVKLGDTIRIGEAMLQLRGTIVREPDAAASGLIFGPRVMISAAALAADQADPAGRAGHLRLPVAASRRGRCRAMDRGGAGRLSAGGLADPQLWRSGAPIAGAARPDRAVSVAGRVDRAAGRRGRHRQCGPRPYRRQRPRRSPP